MKAKTTASISNDLATYKWDEETVTELVCGEFLFQYGEYDEVEIVEVTDDYVQFLFHNRFARDVRLQIDAQYNITEVN